MSGELRITRRSSHANRRRIVATFLVCALAVGAFHLWARSSQPRAGRIYLLGDASLDAWMSACNSIPSAMRNSTVAFAADEKFETYVHVDSDGKPVGRRSATGDDRFPSVPLNETRAFVTASRGDLLLVILRSRVLNDIKPGAKAPWMACDMQLWGLKLPLPILAIVLLFAAVVLVRRAAGLDVLTIARALALLFALVGGLAPIAYMVQHLSAGPRGGCLSGLGTAAFVLYVVPFLSVVALVNLSGSACCLMLRRSGRWALISVGIINLLALTLIALLTRRHHGDLWPAGCVWGVLVVASALPIWMLSGKSAARAWYSVPKAPRTRR